jgi:ABC-type molybdate transport system substrate-binding protein
VIIGGCAVTGGSQAQDGGVLRVTLAGTMEQVIRRQIEPAFTAATGYTLDITRQSSVLLANRITSGELTPDVYISSDANVMELIMGPANHDRARWYLPILRSRTVIMHGTQSRFNNDIEMVRAGKLPWYELMQRAGLVLKRPNPTIDSGGYRAIFDLGERLYKLPGLKQRVLGNDDNESQYFDRTKDFPLIRDGTIDVFVTYITNPLVEGLIGWIRRNLLVPVPRATSLDALNEQLLQGCRRRLGDRLRGHAETIGERLVRDLAAFHDLPPVPYEACEKKTGRVSSLSLVRYRGTDYSVPTAYGHREVLIRGYVHEVVICCGAEIIARHPRSYEREDFVFNPLHYLPLLEQKIGALDQAAPLVGWDLPEEFATLRRLLEARMAKRGKREFVQVLRLLEVFRPADVLAGVREAIARGAIGFDAVKHLVLCRIERRPPRLDLTVYPYLPRASVAMTSAKAYLDLLAGATS